MVDNLVFMKTVLNAENRCVADKALDLFYALILGDDYKQLCLDYLEELKEANNSLIKTF